MHGAVSDKSDTKTESSAVPGGSSDATKEASKDATKYDFMVVSNRLPVDRCAPGEPGDDGSGWRRSPGGLVTALAPMMTRTDGAWVGWHGAADETVEPFSHGGMDLVPVQLSSDDVVVDRANRYKRGETWERPKPPEAASSQ